MKGVRFERMLCSLVLLTACLAVPRAAGAGVVPGVEVLYGMPVGEQSDDLSLEGGLGFRTRVGYELPVPLVRLMPEVSAGWLTLGHAEADHSWKTVAGGVRLGLSTPVAPSVWFHVGHGWISAEGSDWSLDKDGLLLEGGVAFDLTFLPLVNVGLFGGYRSLRYDANSNDHDTDTLHCLEAGLDVELSF